MRAFAVLTAAGLVLVALPATAAATSNNNGDAPAGSIHLADSTTVLAGFPFSGLGLGIAAWLAVAVLAMGIAMVALKRSGNRARVIDDSNVSSINSARSASSIRSAAV